MSQKRRRNFLTDLYIKTAPASEPVTVADLTDGGNDYLKVDFADDDTLLGELITAARRKVEEYLGRALITQTLVAHYSDFDSKLVFPKQPVQTVTHVKTVELDTTKTTLTSGTDYYLHGAIGSGTASDKHLIISSTQISQPGRSISDNISDKGLEIEYVAGYGANASDVPDTIRVAIMRIVADLYEYRQNMTDMQVYKIPVNAKIMLDPFKNQWF